MTDADDPTLSSDDLETELERLLTGAAPSAHAPAWCNEVALLVRAARAPGRPDELAGEDDIVRRMRDVRLAVAAGSDADLRVVDDPDDAVTRGDDVDRVVAANGTTVVPGVADLDAYRARHVLDRTYRAKHAAARLEASRHPAVRTLGRVIAMKAAAVTTAAIIGVAAAAAATTGIVATVVVPALTDNEPRHGPSVPPTTERAPGPGTSSGTGGRAPGSADDPLQEPCPMLSACTSTTLSTPAPAFGPAPAPTTTTTTVPRETTAAPTPSTTEGSTPTTAADTPTTTAPEPAPTTTIAEPPPDDPPVMPLVQPDGATVAG